MQAALPVAPEKAKAVNNPLQILLIVCVALCPLLFSPRFSELFEFPKMIFIYGVALGIVGLLGAKWLIEKQITIYSHVWFWLLLAFIVWMTISAYAGLNWYTSLAGYYTRFNGGIASYIAYTVIAYGVVDQLVSTNKAFLRHLMYAWIAGATIVAIWGISEHFGHDPSCLILRGTFTVDCWIPDVQARVFATLGQPNWLAAFLLATLPVGLGLLLTEDRSRVKAVLSLAILAVYAAFWYTYSRAGWFGLAGALGILGLCLPWQALLKQWKWLLVVALGSLMISLTSLNMASLRVESSLSGQGDSSSTGQMRLMVWQGAWEVIKHNPWLGTGPETFAYSFQQFRPAEMNNTDEWNFLYNEAHNQVLDTTASIGLPGLLLWLLLFSPVIATIILSAYFNLSAIPRWHIGARTTRLAQLLSNSRYQLKIISLSAHSDYTTLAVTLAAGVVGVFIAQLFGFAVTITNLLLFIALVIIIAPAIKQKSLALTANQHLTLFVATIAICLACLSLVWRYMAAEILYNANLPSIHSQQNTVRYNSYEPHYRLRLASSYIALADYSSAEQELQTAERLNPHDLVIAKHITFYYRQMAQEDAVWQHQAIAAAQRAIKLAPNDAAAQQDLADIHFAYGHTQEARDAYNRLVELRPQAESYLKRAEYYRLYGPSENFVQDLQKALQLDPDNANAQQLYGQISM